MGNCFRGYINQPFTSLALKKRKKDSKMPELFSSGTRCLSTGLKLLDLLSDFVLKNLYVLSTSACTKARNINSL